MPSVKTEVPVIRALADFQKEVLRANKPVLVKFAAAMCSACQNTKSHIEEIAKRYGTRLKVVEVELAVGKDKRDVNILGHTYGIFDKTNLHTKEIVFEGRGLPTLSLFVNGNEIEQFNFNMEHFTDLNTVIPAIEETIIKTALTIPVI